MADTTDELCELGAGDTLAPLDPAATAQTAGI